MFAEDTQLSHSESADNYSDLARSLVDGVKDAGLWMEENKLKLNNDKTEAIRFWASTSVDTTLQLPLTVSLDNIETEFSGIIHNLGFIFDSSFWMKQNIIKTCKSAYIEIRCIDSVHSISH